MAQEFDTSVESALKADARKALESVKALAPPMIFEDAVNGLAAKAKEHKDRNRQALDVLNNAKQAAIRAGDKVRLAELVKQHRQLSLEPLRIHRAQYIKELGQSAKAASDQRHAQLQQAGSKTEPQATQVPLRRDMTPAITRQQGESQEAYMKRKMSAEWASAQIAR